MSDGTCSVEGCGGAVAARGWCRKHYGRWHRTGDVGPAQSLRRSRAGTCEVEECDRPIRGAGLCGAHHARLLATGDVRSDEPIRDVDASVEDRFWAKVDRRGPDECWPWVAQAHHQFGYGRFALDGEAIEAHRVALVLSGVDVSGWHVCHRCDFPPCCNPAHLFLGTADDNYRDKIAKGRQATGERHGNARFSDADVAGFHRLREQGLTYREIGERFDCPPQSVWSATHRKHSDTTGHRRFELVADLAIIPFGEVS